MESETIFAIWYTVYKINTAYYIKYSECSFRTTDLKIIFSFISASCKKIDPPHTWSKTLSSAFICPLLGGNLPHDFPEGAFYFEIPEGGYLRCDGEMKKGRVAGTLPLVCVRPDS